MARMLCVLFVASGLASEGCSEPTCSEPVVSGAGQEGQPCATVLDCLPGLTCIGTSFVGGDGFCASPANLPGGVEPGCLTHATEWEEHQSHGVRPPTVDAQGCQVLTFEGACDCVAAGNEGGCVPVFPLYRMERWRSCNGCCYRLVAFWLDQDACL